MKQTVKYTLLVFTLVALLLITNTVHAQDAPWKGYTDRWGYWIPGLITNETWMTPLPTYTKGKAVFYGPFAMDATAEYRGIDYEEEGCLGGISLMSPYNIGDKVWVRVQNRWYGPFCSVDCARRGDMYSIVIHRGEVAELNFELAQEIGMVKAYPNGGYEVYEWFVNVEVLVNISPEQYFAEGKINPEPIDYPAHFEDTLEFATGYEPRVFLTNEGLWKEYDRDKYWLKEEPQEPMGYYLEDDKCYSLVRYNQVERTVK